MTGWTIVAIWVLVAAFAMLGFPAFLVTMAVVEIGRWVARRLMSGKSGPTTDSQADAAPAPVRTLREHRRPKSVMQALIVPPSARPLDPGGGSLTFVWSDAASESNGRPPQRPAVPRVGRRRLSRARADCRADARSGPETGRSRSGVPSRARLGDARPDHQS